MFVAEELLLLLVISLTAYEVYEKNQWLSKIKYHVNNENFICLVPID